MISNLNNTETITCTLCQKEQTFCNVKRPLTGLCTICRKKEWRKNNPSKKMEDIFCVNCNIKVGKNSQTKLCRICYVASRIDIIRKYNNNYDKERCKKDINFKLAKHIRSRISHAIYKNYIRLKMGSSIFDLGCSIEELKKYLEAKFQPGMSWANYGEWHIDHIEPLCSFNLSNPEQFKQACHYSNLQPLYKKDHYIKTALDIKKSLLKLAT